MSELMDIILDCENRLGWSPPGGIPLWRARAVEHRKLTVAMEFRGYTEADLRLALAYLIRRREAIRSPLELIRAVEVARSVAVVPSPILPMEEQIRAALDWELGHMMGTDWEDWCSRLVRAAGHARADVLSEWRAAGRG